MQNFTDVWGVILDDNGKPLVGKIGFYEPNTTTLKNIFGTDEVIPLDNPVYCNGITTTQVLLDEGDYTARYWRYIGNGNMESDNNEGSWLLYKTELIKDGSVVRTDFAGNGIVETIDELKDLTGMEDGDICLVHGYYEKDDCPARYFVWHESGTYVDDGGVCIKSNSQNTGAWIMKIPGTYIDVRWFGDIPSNAWNGTSSNLGQRAKAASAANKYKKDLYFPSYTKGTSNGFYVFNGSNTVSVNQNIICDSGVRFVVKYGTTGTVVSCSKLYKEGRYLFVSEQGKQIGGYELHCDWINSSWLNSNTVTPNNWATQGFVIDEMNSPIHFKDVKLKVENTPVSGTVWENCEVNECNKKITNNITIMNMEIDTDWFADDYDYTQLTITGCRILLRNCKDANTYILLKNKQHESDYGDLGEQQINCYVLAGGTIENCYGSITAANHGNWEFHNVSLSLNGFNNADSLNAVDSWFSFTGGNVLSNIALRRGSLSGEQTLQFIADSTFENAELNIPLTLLGINATLRNCVVNKNIAATNIILDHNTINGVWISQNQDTNNIINVDCKYNTWKDGAKHWIYSTLADAKVVGDWVGNFCNYDDSHWIRITRTNLLKADYLHQYSYVGNDEPYLDKFNGYNYIMQFALYRGHLGSERGAFAQTAIPIAWYNMGTNELSLVNRNIVYWKMFTVGTKFTRREASVEILSPTYKAVGISDGDYRDYSPRHSPFVMYWGSNIVVRAGGCGSYLNAICWDADVGDANYVWSFEGPAVDHTQSSYSNGVVIGCLGSNPGESWDTPSVYPEAIWSKMNIAIHINKDIKRSTGAPSTCVGYNSDSAYT